MADGLGIPECQQPYMLVAQAVKAQEIWNGEGYGFGYDWTQSREEWMRVWYEFKNCAGLALWAGKLQWGKAVAERLNLRFIDLDEYIESKWGNIPVLFEKGEEYFRDIETRALKEVSSMDGTVIATGGGVIKEREHHG